MFNHLAVEEGHREPEQLVPHECPPEEDQQDERDDAEGTKPIRVKRQEENQGVKDYSRPSSSITTTSTDTHGTDENAYDFVFPCYDDSY